MSEKMKDQGKSDELQQVISVENRGIKKRHPLIIGSVAVLVIGIIIIFSFTVFSGGNTGKLAEQLDLGNKYLDEMDYERAIVAFNAVLEIDPKNAEAYIGLIQVYGLQGEAGRLMDVYLQAVRELGADAENDQVELSKVKDIVVTELEKLIHLALEEGDYTKADQLADLLASVDEETAQSFKEKIAAQKKREEETGATFLIKQDKTIVITYTSDTIKESYTVENPQIEKDHLEYGWMCFFTDGVTEYEIGTTYWHRGEENPYQKAIQEMQYNLWMKTENGFNVILKVKPQVKNNKIIWEFKIPGSAPQFDYKNAVLTETQECLAGEYEIHKLSLKAQVAEGDEGVEVQNNGGANETDGAVQKGATIMVNEDKTIIVSLTSDTIQESYTVENPEIAKNSLEYGWEVSFTDGSNYFVIGTTHWRYGGEEPYQMELLNMQHNLWMNAGDNIVLIADVFPEVQNHTITWEFRIPEGQKAPYAEVMVPDFDYEHIKILAASECIMGDYRSIN